MVDMHLAHGGNGGGGYDLGQDMAAREILRTPYVEPAARMGCASLSSGSGWGLGKFLEGSNQFQAPAPAVAPAQTLLPRVPVKNVYSLGGA